MSTSAIDVRPAPLVPFLLVVWLGFGLMVALTISFNEAWMFPVFGGADVLSAIAVASVWAARDVRRSTRTALLVAVVLFSCWPAGVYLWVKLRPPGPLFTKVGWFIVGIALAVSAVSLVVLCGFTALLVGITLRRDVGW